ncbi:hypothetical protein PVAP13_5KG639707 [Panicum virgatum]|uniref:Uncharacterized protein n=1 Tax=Panicum virgatum TaxID=38727 RepID=A0A8T0T065_PANVG|nr:hypothetical protein PVAP13_5KG639707 [Panicum virgatum]
MRGAVSSPSLTGRRDHVRWRCVVASWETARGRRRWRRPCGMFWACSIAHPPPTVVLPAAPSCTPAAGERLESLLTSASHAVHPAPRVLNRNAGKETLQRPWLTVQALARMLTHVS